MATILADNRAFQRALAALQAGNVKDAVPVFKAVLRAQPRHIGALNLLGVALTRLGRFDDAEIYLRRASREQPASDATLYNYGIVLKALHRSEEALQRLTEALAINANSAETWYGRGVTFNDLGQFEKALGDFRKVVELDPRHAGAWFACGNAFRDLKRYDEALRAYDKALELEPASAVAHTNRGAVLFQQGRYLETLASCDRAIALAPSLVHPHSNRGGALYYLGRYSEALASCDRAISLDAACVEAWFVRGNILSDIKQYDEALTAYNRTLALRPDFDYAPASRLYAKLQICDWTELEAEIAQLLAITREGKRSNDPFMVVTMPFSASDQLQCARRYAQDQPFFPAIWGGELYSHSRVRLAYLSADFHEHPVADLTVGLFERHDKSRFEVTGISFGLDKTSAMRRRIENACEHFVDAQDQSDQDVADLIRRREIDIAIDLTGFTANNRRHVLAQRPAPIQVNYLGYPGTMGASYIDYILADSTIIPEDQCAFYAEQVVWLPESYQVNDNRRRIGEEMTTRAQCGLPDKAFVYCGFSSAFKIMPEIFDIWMRLLLAVDGSVLWLRKNNELVSSNLRREAERRGVAPERLVFAERASLLADHLARHRQADLFLDTLPYNAHTTASDSLSVGVPVVTCLGSSFAGRVAASVLRSIGLDELIAHSLQEYEALALKLAHDPSYLASIKNKLARNRDTFPLFNTERATRHIESAFTTMIDIWRRGERPRRFNVDPV